MLGSIANVGNTSGAVINLGSAAQRGILGGDDANCQVEAIAVRDSIWILRQGSTFITVRHAKSGEISKKIDVLDEGVSLAAVGEGAQLRIWVSTTSGKMYVFGEEGTLIGLVQATNAPVVTHIFPMPPEAKGAVFTSGPGKDVALWDSQSFTVLRTFFGKAPGEIVTDVASIDAECTMFAVSTTSTVRVWLRSNASLLFTVDAGASALVCDSTFPSRPFAGEGSSEHPGLIVANLWAAHPTVVAVYAVVISGMSKSQGGGSPTISLVKQRVLPCPQATQLLRTTPSHISAIDKEGLISVWSVENFSPVRTFQCASHIGQRQNMPYTMVPATTQASRICWTFGPDDKALMWSDESPADFSYFGSTHRANVKASSASSVTNATTALACGVSKDMEKEEITFLRRKLKYLETMSTLYRQKVGVLFREKGGAFLISKASEGDATRIIGSFNDIDGAYSEALARYEQQTLEQEPLPDYLNPNDGKAVIGRPPQQGQSAEEFVDYWKRKYHESRADIQRLKNDYESMVELFFLNAKVGGEGANEGDVVTSPSGRVISLSSVSRLDAEAEVKRAHHVCQLIKEKNAVKERERQLTEDVARLRAKLREFNTPLASRGPLEDAETLKVQNGVLREEVKKLRSQLDESQTQLQQLQTQAKQAHLQRGRISKMEAAVTEAEIKLSNRTAELQGEIDGVLDKFYGSQKTIELQNGKVRAAETARQQAELASLKKQQIIEDLQQQLDEQKRAAVRQREADEHVIARLREEIQLLCDTLDDRDQKIIDWQNKFEDVSARLRDAEHEISTLRFLVGSKDTEIGVLMERVAHLESVLHERKLYAQTVAEVQGRMELIVEELRNAFTPSEFAASMDKLDERMANLIAVEQQLRHKDDIIAMRDDYIRTLRDNATKLEEQVAAISTVFLQLPKSVEEVEGLMIEVDEYRRRLGMDSQLQSRVRQRLLDLYAKKKVGGAIYVSDMDLLKADPSADQTQLEASKSDLERAQILADALRGLASTAVRDSKIGHVGGPGETYRLQPDHFNRRLEEKPKEEQQQSADVAADISQDQTEEGTQS